MAEESPASQVPLLPDRVDRFLKELRAAISKPDAALIEALCWKPSADGKCAKAEARRLAKVIEGIQHEAGAVSLGFKEFDRLPPQSRARWEAKVRQLTRYEAKGVCFLYVKGIVRCVLPLTLSGEQFLILPSGTESTTR
jgi:hypothetical protein